MHNIQYAICNMQYAISHLTSKLILDNRNHIFNLANYASGYEGFKVPPIGKERKRKVLLSVALRRI